VAEPYKSVLEKHNENLARKRRLPTPEEQAIEPVYPEEYLVGGPGKAVASGFLGSGRQAAKNAAARERISNVKIGSKAIDLQAEKDLIQRLRNRGIDPFEQTAEQAARAKKQAEQVAQARDQKKVLMGAKKSAVKSAGDSFGETGLEVGNQMAEERRNAAGDTYKKGGKVSASSRADGCAVKGKTKGRMV